MYCEAPAPAQAVSHKQSAARCEAGGRAGCISTEGGGLQQNVFLSFKISWTHGL